MNKSTRLLAFLLLAVLAINVLACAAESSISISLDALNRENYSELRSSAVLLAQNADVVIGMGLVNREAQLCSIHYPPEEQNSVLMANVPQGSYVKVFDGQYVDTDSNIWKKVDFEGRTGYLLLTVLTLCSCENVSTDLAGHADSCTDKRYVGFICESMTVQELYEQYQSLPAHIAEFILTKLSWTNQTKLAELQALIDAPRIDCICGINEQDPAMHAGDCDYYLHCLRICDGTAEEIYAQWTDLAEPVRDFILVQLQQTDKEKFIAMQLQMGVLRKIDMMAAETSVTLLGSIPENAQISAEIKAQPPQAVNGEALFTIDITIISNGAVWQPAEGESVRITLDAASLNLADATIVNMLHWVKDDKNAVFAEEIGSASVIDGMLSFTTDSFSQFTGVLNNSENYWKNDDYIFLDLAKGTISIANNSILQKDNNDNTVVSLTGDTLKKEKNGVATSEDKGIYIFQSNADHQSSWNAETNTLTTPQYDRVQAWAEYIDDNSVVRDVVEEWDSRAAKAGRTSTPYYIKISGSAQRDITLDNIWSTHNIKGQGETLRGGLNFNPSSGGKLNLHFVGDNRVAAIHINSVQTEVKLLGAQDATLTVAAFKDGVNFWNSAIGNNDSSDSVNKIVIESGHIFAGTTNHDNCTAIGAGGNGHGVVEINGGIVTAVAATSGTAIGGGIGYHSAGGSAKVTITGGEVYAYNHGIYLQKTTNPDNGKYFIVTASAIGGGSSIEAAGSSGTIVTITGGTVRAYSVGGTAIGGGGSAHSNGGGITVNISGGDVIALSQGGTVHDSGKNTSTPAAGMTATASPGTSIGGGTGRALGGTATVNISGNPTIYTGSIGGGYYITDTGHIGAANVTISGGTTHGQVVMAAGAQTDCSFNMTGGIIDNASQGNVHFIRDNGRAVYVENGKAELSGGTVRNSNALNGGAFYVIGGDFEMTGGTIENCHATADNGIGGAVCVISGTALIRGGVINGGAVNPDGGLNENAVNNAYYGGAVGISGGDFEMYNGTVQESAAQYGGGIYIDGGTCVMYGGTVDANIARVNGGAVYVKDTGVSFGVISSTGLEYEAGDLIVNGNSAVSGGGFYVDQTAGEHSIRISNGVIRSNTASVNGGGIAVDSTGGTVQINVKGGEILHNSAANGAGVHVQATGGTANITVDGGTIQGNAAFANGGGIAVKSTDGTAQITVKGGEIYQNTADNGAGVYVLKDTGSGSANMTVDGGQIKANIARFCGGGIYQSGSGSTITVSGDTATIQENVASNGGGIYLIADASLTVSGGSITANKAVINPENYNPQNAWTDTEQDYIPEDRTKTAYHKNEVKGVGGGVSLAKGASATQFILDAKEHSVGIFGNLAQYAADDVFASGDGTQLNLPLKKDMNITGGLVNVENWFEDYPLDDSAYANGLCGNDKPGTGTGQVRIERCRTARETIYAYPYNDLATTADDGYTYMNTANMYVCATLGVKRSGTGVLTIRKLVAGKNEDNQLFLFDLDGVATVDGSLIQLQSALRHGDEVAISALPDGKYTVRENNVWSWRYELQSIVVNVYSTDENNHRSLTRSTEFGEDNPIVNGGVEIDIDADNRDVELIFTNKKTTGQWLDQDIGSARNEYGVIYEEEDPDQTENEENP